MHGWETRMLLKHYLDRGVSKAELSRRFGVSRRTIHEWVVTGQLDRDLSSGGSRYSPRPPVPHKLDPYAGIIDSRLEEFPGLSAQRLLDEVRAAGYPGGYSRVRDYVRAVRPREAPEPVVRFETPAGRQGQVDFAIGLTSEEPSGVAGLGRPRRGPGRSTCQADAPPPWRARREPPVVLPAPGTGGSCAAARNHGSRSSTAICASGRASGATLSPAPWLVMLL